MQIVIKIPFRKTLIIVTFIALLSMAGYSIAMMIMGGSIGASGSSLPLAKSIVDIVLWIMFALWFLVLILYKSNSIGHKGLNIVTSLTTLAVFAKVLLSIALVISINHAVWTIVFSVIELIIWIGLLVCIANVWFKSADKA